MIKLIIGFVVIVLIGFIAAIQEAYENGYAKGYMEGMRNCEELHRKENEYGQEDKSKSV